MNVRALPFVAPFLLFMLLLSVEGWFPNQHYLFYPVRTALVVAVIVWFWKALPDLRPSAPILSMAIGIAGVVLWVGLYPWAMQLDDGLERLFNRVVLAVGFASWQIPIGPPLPGLDPFQLYPAGEAWTLFVLRVLGISLCVPVMEELFWRGFLMRWLIQEDFTSVPLGAYQPASFWITTLCFTSVHGDLWPLALLVGVIYGTLFVRTKSLGNIMLAHGVTNFLLAFYCLFANEWHFLATVAPLTK